MRTAVFGFIAASALAGCKKDDGFDPMMTQVDTAGTPLRIEVGSAVGVESVRVPVRALNAYGAAVPGGSVDLSVTGSAGFTDTTSVSLDFSGVGLVEFTPDVPQALTVTATASSAGADLGDPATSWVVGGETPEYGLPPAWGWVDEAELPFGLHQVANGLVYAQGARVVFQRTPAGSPPMIIAELPAAIAGLKILDLDLDGLPDLAAWSGSEIVVLRGRGAEGFLFGAAFSTGGPTVTGAASGDVDDDLSLDLAISFAEGGAGGLQTYATDGVWGFEPLLPLSFQEEPWSLALGDFTGNNTDALAVMTEGDGQGRVRRIALREEGWLDVGIDIDGLDLANDLDPGSEIIAAVDTDGDALDELIFAQAAVNDNPRTLYMATFKNGVLLYDFRHAGLRVGVGDATGDGVADLAFSELNEGQLHVITVDNEDDRYFNRTVANDVEAEAVAVGQFTADGVGDLALGQDLLRVLAGGFNAESGEWALDGDSLTNLYVNATGPQRVGDYDGDGLAELLTVRSTSGQTYVQLYDFAWSDTEGVSIDTSSVNRLDLGPESAQVIDLAVCGDLAFALVGETQPDLMVVQLGETLSLRGQAATDGVAVACGDLGGAAAAVLDAGGQVQTFDDRANASSTLTVDAGAADLAIVNGEVAVCTTAGCEMLGADLDGDGTEELIVGGETAQITAWGADYVMPWGGTPSVIDVDGDGRLDVLFSDEVGRVAVHRTVEGSVAPAMLWASRKLLVGPMMAGDVDGDGLQELFISGQEGRLLAGTPSTWAASDEPEE
ncbi:MAG: hypothetical protein H6739_30545 [Alphaproteobacteria bacterium]|nr:hypothetical protein [Alphaproteobacteria bacterium]